MVHLRIVAPSHEAAHALDLLKATDSVVNLIHLERAAQKPEGDVILCDVAREDASVIISDLKRVRDRPGRLDRDRGAGLDDLRRCRRRREGGAGLPTDAVVWEEVESRTSENTELSGSFIVFFVLACCSR